MQAAKGADEGVKARTASVVCLRHRFPSHYSELYRKLAEHFLPYMLATAIDFPLGPYNAQLQLLVCSSSFSPVCQTAEALHKYNEKLMNSIWGLYNMNAPHAFQKNTEVGSNAPQIMTQKSRYFFCLFFVVCLSYAFHVHRGSAFVFFTFDTSARRSLLSMGSANRISESITKKGFDTTIMNNNYLLRGVIAFDYCCFVFRFSSLLGFLGHH